MKFKEALNNHAGIVIGVVILALLIAGWSVLRNLGGGPNLGASTAFYSDDDGKTWFRDKASLTTPFDHDGKPACVAHVYRCKDKEFVAYLERAGDQVVPRDQAAPAPTSGKGEAAAKSAMGGPGMGFVKKPGAKDWVSKGNFRRASTEMTAACEGVAPTDVVYVIP